MKKKEEKNKYVMDSDNDQGDFLKAFLDQDGESRQNKEREIQPDQNIHNEIIDSKEIILAPREVVSRELILSKEEEQEILEKDSFEDYQFSRRKYKKLLFQSQEILDSRLEAMKDDAHPRSIEVYGALLKHSADITDKLMDLHKSQKVLRKKEKEEIENGLTTNNNMFISSTDDLQRMLKEIKKND